MASSSTIVSKERKIGRILDEPDPYGPIEENAQLGPRYLLKPTKDVIDGMSVFISHDSAERVWAEDVGLRLQAIGFKPVLVPPIGSQPDHSLTEDEVAELLEKEVRNSDHLILLVSASSVPKYWVRQELKLAARTKGRAIYLYRSGCAELPAFHLPPTEPGENPLALKHTILRDEGDTAGAEFIAQDLITDPDEGFRFPSRGIMLPHTMPLPASRRNLLAEIRLKHVIRDWLCRMWQYRDRRVVNVFPCFWKEMGLDEGMIDDATEWCRVNYGSRDLDRVGRDYALSWVTAPLEGDDRVCYPESDHIWALLVWEPYKDYGATVISPT